MKMQVSETLSCYAEYAAELKWLEKVEMYKADNCCMSCGGEGHHGYEEGTGCVYTCFACGGTGSFCH